MYVQVGHALKVVDKLIPGKSAQSCDGWYGVCRDTAKESLATLLHEMKCMSWQDLENDQIYQ